jgi:hypothetical protein
MFDFKSFKTFNFIAIVKIRPIWYGNAPFPNVLKDWKVKFKLNQTDPV